jgi:protein O-GlcNAc transferase
MASTAPYPSDAAEDALRREISAHPGRVDPWARLAEYQVRRGDFDGAVFSLAAAIQIAPESAPLQANLAYVFLTLGKVLDAEKAARRALAVNPAHSLARMHLAHALARQGRWSEAARDYEEAARRIPGFADPWIGRANAQLHAGLRREAVATLKHAVTIEPARAEELESFALFTMQYGDEFSAREVFDAHVAWGKRFADADERRPPRSSPDSIIRVGYVSASFHTSAMSFAMLPVLASHDQERFQVTCYSGGEGNDDFTELFQGNVAQWRDTRALDDEQLARRIYDDRIDVLVDLAGHTLGNRLTAFALRAAPVQLSWLDYFNTTGVPAMDAVLVDDEVLRTPLSQSFVERLESLGPVRYPWGPPSYAPEPVVRTAGPVTFASFSRFGKATDATLDAWAAVLHKVDGSRLLLKNDSLGDSEIRARVVGLFAARGIEAGRLDLRGASIHGEMLAQYGDADIVLDTFPYNGGITTLEALWMGRPVVTLRGDTLVGRQGASILTACGKVGWVASDAQGYVAIAAALAGDRTALAAQQSALRDSLIGSPLLDAAAFTRRLEALYERLLKSLLAEDRPRP